MREFEYRISVEHNIYPNITVYEKYLDGAFAGWKVVANEGYKMYDETANNTELDIETGEEIPVTQYTELTYIPKMWNWKNFHYVAVQNSILEK